VIDVHIHDPIALVWVASAIVLTVFAALYDQQRAGKELRKLRDFAA
jgi:hypothetical protein